MKKLLLFIPLLAFSCGKLKQKQITFRNNTGKSLNFESYDLGVSIQIKDKDYYQFVEGSGQYQYYVNSTDSTTNYEDVVTVKRDNVEIELHL